MASSGNFGTWNPLADYSSGTTFSNGNCTTAISQQNQYRACLGPAIPDSGKWYIEFFIDHQSSGFPSLMGLLDGTINSSLSSGNYLSNAGSFHIEPMSGKLYSESTIGTSYTGNSGSPSAVGDADAKVAIAIDRDNNKLWFAVNNTWINVGSGVGDPANDSNPAVSSLEQNLSISHGIRQATGTSKVVINCGQDSTFGGLETAGGNADDNGFGDFFYAPPSGFLALCSGNLPVSDDIDPAGDSGADENPTKQFGILTYTGTASSQSISGLGFSPDVVWAKSRSASQSNRLADSSRGSAVMFPDTTGANDTTAGISFDSDGFSWTNSDGSNANDSGVTYVAWCWKCAGGTETTNNDGATTSYVQANTKSGFSIVRHSVSLPTTTTLGHGLEVAPEYVVHKLTASSNNWNVWHTGLTSGSYIVRWNTNNAEFTASHFNSTVPTSSVISTGASLAGSGAGIAYCWHSVEGYSKFGSYEGNGNNDGPFIYTGFRPRYWFFKEIDANDDWVAYDTTRDTANTNSSKVLRYDSSTSEFDDSGRAVDVLSNGLKIRTSNNTINYSGNTYIYGAWADVPFKYNNTF